ncbi:MAG: hypothetical protein A3K83_03250 [Omnitrophica WOR_2 bacterium RBG_13_44_8b]|nr:MAG: hypothetical protein A3K83_03250 [Omnitrophica WOR_2 bacterium RBG_13_44_8b]
MNKMRAHLIPAMALVIAGSAFSLVFAEEINSSEVAQKIFEKAGEYSQENAPSPAIESYNKAVNLFNANSTDEAIQELNKTLSIDPYYGKAYLLRGRAYCVIKDFRKALVDLNKATECDPSAETYFWRGVGYSLLPDIDRAIDDFCIALGIDPEYAIAYYHRGLAYWARHDYAGAVWDFEDALTYGWDIPEGQIKQLEELCYNDEGCYYEVYEGGEE